MLAYLPAAAATMASPLRVASAATAAAGAIYYCSSSRDELPRPMALVRLVQAQSGKFPEELCEQPRRRLRAALTGTVDLRVFDHEVGCPLGRGVSPVVEACMQSPSAWP